MATPLPNPQRQQTPRPIPAFVNRRARTLTLLERPRTSPSHPPAHPKRTGPVATSPMPVRPVARPHPVMTVHHLSKASR
jgi:hypothetical protein